MKDAGRPRDIDDSAKMIIRQRAERICEQCGFTKDDREDLEQELTLHLLERAQEFDPSRASWNTFVARITDNKATSIIRHHGRQKRNFRLLVCSLDDTIDCERGRADTRETTHLQDGCDPRMGTTWRFEVEEIDMRVDVSRVLSELSRDLQQLAQRLKTHTITEVARELGIPRSTLYSRDIARLRRTLEESGVLEYIRNSSVQSDNGGRSADE